LYFAKMMTLLIHGDAEAENIPDVAPPIHLSTTYRKGNKENVSYAREDTITRRRVELILGKLDYGHGVLFASGIGATVALFIYFKPRRIIIEKGYLGTHNAAKLYQSIDQTVEILHFNEPTIKKGDLIWVEIIRNPTCEIEDIVEWSNKAHAVGANLVVDSTFASPILSNPLNFGADAVMHSVTKFIGGHSDILAGSVILPTQNQAEILQHIRTNLGSIPGSLESWLILRSVRTLELRVLRQSASATEIAKWLTTQHNVVTTVHHPSLPTTKGHHLLGNTNKHQLKGGGGVLSFEMTTPEAAQLILSKIKLIKHATSLGGVESLLDYRYTFDKTVSPTLLRFSVGLENPEDLIQDLRNAFQLVSIELRENKPIIRSSL